MEIFSGNKNYFKLLPVILLVHIGCDTVSDNLKDEQKSLIKISITDSIQIHEAISWIDFELRDETKSVTAVDAYYLGARVGLGAFEGTLDEFTKRGKIELNTFTLPETAVLSIVAKNDNRRLDSITLNISVLKREQKEFYSLPHGGDLPFTAVSEGIKLPDGRVLAVSSSGYIVFNTDFSFSTASGSSLKNVVLNDAGEACVIDNQARIFRWNGSSLEKIGQIEIPAPNGHPDQFGDVIYVNGEYYTIPYWDNARIFRYNCLQDSTVVFNLSNEHIFEGAAIAKGPGNTVLAAYKLGSSIKLFKLTGDNSTEIQLPEIDYYSGPICIYTDSYDITWISFYDDLYQLTGESFQKIELPNIRGFFAYRAGGEIRKIYRDENENLWIVREAGILRYSNKGFIFYPGATLAKQYVYNGDDGETTLVLPGIDGGVFCVSRGIDIGSVLTHLAGE